jgi:hypothetical protein
MRQISKFLALILRHKPEAAGVVLDGAGWADVEAVIAAVARRFGGFDRGRLEELVRSNDKQRYAFDESGTRIRANQGHSVPVELELERLEPPPLLYHGTAERFLASILAEGLMKGRGTTSTSAPMPRPPSASGAGAAVPSHYSKSGAATCRIMRSTEREPRVAHRTRAARLSAVALIGGGGRPLTVLTEGLSRRIWPGCGPGPSGAILLDA